MPPIEFLMSQGWLGIVFKGFAVKKSMVFAAPNHFAHFIIQLHNWISMGGAPPLTYEGRLGVAFGRVDSFSLMFNDGFNFLFVCFSCKQ